MFRKILVANRAEIAVRVLRTCRELGISGVAVHSTPDAGALHVRTADEAVHLPGTSPAETYLDIDAIIGAALGTGAEAIHPGYGFLAEHAGFAEAVRAAGLTFIGPSPSAISIMGEKVAARRVATEADVPQVPGTTAAIESFEEILEFGATYGYPVAVKASYGGGGRGMRTVAGPEDARDAWESARREAVAAFGRGEVYLERYLLNARHVEVQIFADSAGSVVWLGDRDCSVQRRHQKIVEEAPAPGLSDELRSAMGEASARLARAVGYLGAGTVEYLVETDPERFYFLEMNTRIQVEHPVTEVTLGLDLIAEQIRVAAGLPLGVAGSAPVPRGHAIEVRVNAEDVTAGVFRPAPGLLTALEVPTWPGVRFDGGYVAGDEVLPYYDSLIGKLIVWAPSRDHAIARALACIKASTISGVPTTLPAAELVLGHPDFRDASVSTRWLENHLDLTGLVGGSNEQQPEGAVAVLDKPDRGELYVGGRRYAMPRPLASISGATAQGPGGDTSPQRRGGAREPRKRAAGGKRSGTVVSPMQGTIVKIAAEAGQAVAQGDIVMVIEAMKMENPIRAAVNGIVQSVTATVGQVVPAGARLAEITPDAS